MAAMIGRGTSIVRGRTWILIVAALALLDSGCHRHRERAVMCPHPAMVVGADAGGDGGGWVVVRQDQSAGDTAARIAATYHVRTQSLISLHGFSTYPVPQGSQFLCDKDIVEVHYDPPHGVVSRPSP